jgi:hypothetical protein
MTPVAKARPPLVPLLGILGVSVLFHIVIVETAGLPAALSIAGVLKLGVIGFSALGYWALYTSLLVTFGLTLRRGHTPLITGMAHRLHDTLSDEMIRYTRGVTIAWCVFFAVQLLTSIGLFCFAPITAWSVFVNLLDFPLVVTMFAAEYACRLRLLRDPPRHSLAMIVEMVSNCMRQPPAGSSPPGGLPGQ